MRLSHLNVRTKRVAALLFAAVFVAYALYTTGHYVTAYRETKSAHVFPTAVTANGWNNAEAALAQELGSDAPFESFTQSNSAYITIAGNTPVGVTAPSAPAATSTEPSPSTDASSTPPTTGETPSAESAPVEPTIPEAPADTESATPVETPVEAPPAPTETPAAPAPEQAPSETSVSKIFHTITSALVPTVFATTTEPSLPDTTDTSTAADTPAVTEDVATCFLQQKECHTITLDGFAVSGEITETNFESATLNFSFAAGIGETELIDDKLEVRYYHAGKWREVGEIFLNKQLSNASNGAYFTATLDDVLSWEELSDVKVVIEYDRNNDSAVDLYLDAVWIDSHYHETLSDVVSDEDGVPELPDNVVMELNEGGSVGELVLSDGTRVSFPFTDDLDDTLMVRTDKASYGRSGETVYASLTNTSGVADSVRLYTAFPRGFGKVIKIEELKKNLPTTTETPQYQDVTYLCEGGWQTAGESASSTAAAYRCAATEETHACSTLNADKTNCSVTQVQVGSESSVTYTSGWVPLTSIDGQDDQTSLSGFLPPEYRILSKTTETIDILPGQTVYIRMQLESTEKDSLQFTLLAQGAAISGDLNSELLKGEDELKGEGTPIARKKGNTRMFGRAEFDGDELPSFKFQFKSKRNFVSRGLNVLLGRGNEFGVADVTFKREDGTEVSLPVGVEYQEDGTWTLEIKTHPREFRPGKYSADIVMHEGTDEFTESVEFYWGVLAMNVNQSSYKPGEIVPIALAALDDAGDTICDADLRLSVTDPTGLTTPVDVIESGLCGDNNVIDVADYLATYTTSVQGRYTASATEYDDRGLIVHRVFDTFEVREEVPFVIRRAGMTRIYPVAAYTMDLELTSASDYVGEFIEPIPADFELVLDGGAEIRMYGGAKNLVWPVNLKAGETMKVSYSYDAPDISPYMYLLGPAQVADGQGVPFEEPRQWKIASDATGNMLLYWDSTYIPTGWTCVSCLPSDSFYQRFVMGSSTAGTNGGSATTAHTATGAVAASAASQTVLNTATAATPVVAHTHTFTPTITATSTLPAYRQLAIIQFNSAGEPSTIPTGAIAMFDATVPSGWTTYSTANGRYLRGESTSTVGVQAGSNTHRHDVSGTTGAAATTVNVANPGTIIAVAAAAHTHNLTATTTELVNNEPPYIEVILGKLNATTTPTNQMIAMWSGDPPTGWTTTSSSSEAMANKFVKASTTYGTTGGAFTHSHINMSNIPTGAPSATANRGTGAGATVATAAHTHTVNVTSFTSDSHLPPYRTAVFAKRVGGAAPSGPTLYDILFDNERTGTSTPAFEFSATDPDGADTLIYEFQWDDDSDLNTSPIGDRTSDVETGCSPNCFENLTTPANNSPFTEGNRIRFTIQTPLVSGTTYYWRVRARESGGGGTWGSWATTTSFTYLAGTDPSQWFQTEDAQFDTNTMSGTETFGSNSARLDIAPSQEAMVVYGEGVVQTPRYRIWNGTSWSAESSANNVGGTIQWVVNKSNPVRDEYVAGTQDASNDVNVQIFDGTTDTWGTVTEMTTTVANPARRGFDLTFESSSGDIMTVYCDGDADPSYRVWSGSSWSAPQTVNIGSANNCEWISLASDPNSDEIILVERDTGSVYEAQVWDGSAWGNAKTLGSMTDLAHEGIAVNYEESGDQAMVVVSNGNTNGFAWTTWSGSSWGISQTQALGDDFEWGTLKADVGTDKLSLCYIDNDADIGTLVWDGSAWDAFTAGGDERETGGNIFDGRAVDCSFETTTGRDGYVMLPYSDTTNGRYQYYDNSVWSAEASVSTIQDSWTVKSVRTSAGGILAFFHDDVNARYDFSDWNGTAWSTATTLETSPSVTVAPFLQPIDMAAQAFESSTGSMTSRTIDFDQVPGRQQWGEVQWHTTEAAGTDVKIQVMYDAGSGCNTLVPNAALNANPGLNSIGYDATTTPLNISALSTSTYNRICLKANFTTSSINAPQLDDWAVTWERQPYLTQAHFRWYANAATSLTPNDAWPVGGTDLAEDSPIQTVYAPSPGDVLRLRMSVLTENVAIPTGDLSLKLQYAVGATCSAALTWQDVGAVGSTTAAWRGYDNASLSDGATLASTLLSGSDSLETYEEANDSAVNPNSVAVGNEGEWDWVIQHNSVGNTNYCFRVVTFAGVTMNEYDIYPSLITDSPPGAPTLEAPFNNEALASTTPWFQFVSEDPENDDVTYQVQIDDASDFSSVNIDRDSQNNFTEFQNLVTPSDKDPFTPSNSARFIPSSSLTNGTTYYWRVRAKDRTKSAEWSSWSDIQSFTVDTSVTISTWKQTTLYQFAQDDHQDTEATSTNDVIITPGFTQGTTSGQLIDFDWKTTGNAWGSFSFSHSTTSSSIRYHIEYFDGNSWSLIPDSDLTGNALGFVGTTSLLSVSPTIYNQIRIRADMTNSGATPHLLDWTISWGYAVEQPSLTALFDNEKSATTTPTFSFKSTDPQSDDLVYELSISTTRDFTSSTTRRSSLNAGFVNSASSTDTSPFTQNNLINFTLQAADALTNGTTYWWRVRAIDPSGGNVWSVWSDLRSFTVDTSVGVSTWFQTTNEQFNTDTLSSIETSGGKAQITSTIKEAFMVYSEGTVQSPRYRLWNGTAWGSELTGVSVGDTIRFEETAAAPTRDEYIIATEGSTGVVDAQVVDGSTDTSGNIARMNTAVSDPTQRGFDVAYETTSGDALVVSCFGTEATYRVWNGTSWTATSTITLSVSTNCEWIKLISDPNSDEIILVARDTTTGTNDYEALVWSGSAWGNSTIFGGQVTVANEGIAAEYEESGDQAVVVVSNTSLNSFVWRAWNGSAWGATSTVAIGNDFEDGRLVRDVGTDRMTLCYIDADSDIGYATWGGSAWSGSTEVETLGNSVNDRPVSCEYETVGSRDGYTMMLHSDTTQVEYESWNGSATTAPAILNTVTDASEIRTARTGDGLLLAFVYDDANTEYDFSYWDGSAWSAEQQIEPTSITTVAPPTIPIDIVARRYPAFVAGSVESTAINFTDGTGPKWGAISFSKTTPGSSTVKLQVEYFTSTSSWALIPDSVISGNSVGTTTTLDMSNVNRITYSTIRLIANLTCVAGNCPTLNDWTLTWAQGINISGTVQQYNQSSNVTSGTVAVAVNGVKQVGKTATISGSGTFTIANVTVFQDDIVTVFVDGAGDASEAVGITKYDGNGDITGMNLYERHLSIGSDDNQTITNTDISQYDMSVSADDDIFYDVDAGNDLAATSTGTVWDVELWIKSGTTYRPDSASSGFVSVYGIENNGTITADGNTITLLGSWDNNSVFNKDASTVVFAATSSARTIDSTGASVSTFNHVTFGTAATTATWSLTTPLDVDGNLTINFGTLSPSSTAITIAGNLSIGASGVFTKGTATTTFDGTTSATWTDNTAAKQDLGSVLIDGTNKTVQLGAAAKATNITIGSDDTLSAGSSYALEVTGNWTNSNVFTAQSGTVTFSATSTGKTVAPGSSSFYNVTFNGVGGNWAFTSGVTAGNDFTIATGTVTMPSATTTITGSFLASGGAFQHNNGAVVFNSAAAGKSVTPGNSSFYDLTFSGTGSWSFGSTNATSSRHLIITQGAVTLPTGTLAVGGSFVKTGGSFAHSNGTLKLTANNAQTVRFSGSDAYATTFSGTGGSWSFLDASATSTNNVRFEAGTSTLPSGTFAVGGSWTVTSGGFSANAGTVKFVATSTSKTITPGVSVFANMIFDGSGGGWTISASTTATGAFSLTTATNFTVSPNVSLAVGGTFTNGVGGAATTWATSTLALYSGTSYSLNTKSTGGDVYGTLSIGANTNIRDWNSTAATTTVSATGSLYSQDNATLAGSPVDGDLYIWGAFTSGSNEYWSYATDFDGTALGGSPRQVNVRIATSSTITYSAGTLQILGAANATTTIQNQGTGRYAFSITGGTLNAQYYSVKNGDVNGLSISGTTAITSLGDGDLELGVNGGTALKVTSTVIDANPALQIQRNRFATSTGITSGFNVTETGTPSSYWWFRNHYGNYAGENFDSDPGGNPGFIRWDDSGFTISVSGNVYTDEGSTSMGSPTCDGVTQNVRIVVNFGSFASSTSCASGTGAYTISGVSFSGDAVLTTYLNTNGGARAVAVTRTATANVTGMNLYQDEIIVRHEDTAPLTIANMAVYDSSDDSDIPFTAATGSPDTLVVAPRTELHVWTGKTFVPGGNMTLQSGGANGSRDGRLHIATSSVFTATGAESHSIGGGLVVQSGATFTSASSTFTFTATTTNKSIYALSSISLWNATFNGSGGSWSFDNGFATTTILNTAAFTAGTLTGSGDLTLTQGSLTGSGTVNMTGGTITLENSGTFGNSNNWQFSSLSLGNGVAAGSSVKTGTGTTTITGILRVNALQRLYAATSSWVLSGTGTPFTVINTGNFHAQVAPFTFSGNGATTIADQAYAALLLTPSSAGTPTYTLRGGVLSATTLAVGGTNPVVVDANTNDPSISVSGSVVIGTSSTFTASNVGALDIGGSWSNLGTFTASGATVNFNSTDTGETIDAGASSFNNVSFNGVGGGWTISQNATTTGSLSLTNGNAFTLSPNRTLAVGGTFTNSLTNSATTWATSTLSLYSGTSYTMNSKAGTGDIYGTLSIGASTNVRMWNSSAATTTVNLTGSLYSQDHAGVDGSLYIWGAYTRSSGSDYWSYATDFDGASTSTARAVSVNIATSSSVAFSGGSLDIIGIATASTTIQNQGTGRYAFSVSGGTFNAQYYQIRNTDPDGLNFSGSPTINALTDGDLELGVNGGSVITVAGTVIDANPLKIFQRNRFATTTAGGISSGFNVKATGSSVSSWKFNLHYGAFAGEAYDSDPDGDPGYIRWDDSASSISISGNVYADEGTTVSGACNGSTQVVRLKIQGAGTYTASCSSATGAYSISGVAFNPGDTITVFLDNATGTRRAANVSIDPVSSISNMHLYENRVIVRHEDTNPITIAKMALYDSDQDSDIPFNAVDAATDTLTLVPNTKLIVFNNKTFAPGGNITLTSGGLANAFDGTLELFSGSLFSGAANQSHSIGGSIIVDGGASLATASSTITMTATTTGKTLSLNGSTLYNIVFSGTGGNWAFASSTMTALGDFTVTAGTVTMPSATTTIGSSFINSGGTLQHNNGAIYLTATTTGKSVRLNNSNLYSIEFNGSGGAWTMFDSSATSSNNFVITAGTVTAPSTMLTVGGSFQNSGTFTSGVGTIKFIANATGKSITTGASALYNVLIDGVGGGWTMTDTNSTVTRDFTILHGTTTLPTGTLTVGGSWATSGGGFTATTTGTVLFNATTTGKTIDPGISSFGGITFNSASGGWTISQNATSTGATAITAATSFTLSQNRTLAVGGTFTNSVGGAATTWATTTLSLYSGTNYSINTKSAGNDVYGTLLVGANTDVRMWNSTAATTTVNSTGSLYSQDNAALSGTAVDGDLYIWGEYVRSSGNDYWSYATDFDGTALGGSSRIVNVRIATSSSITLSGGSLDIVGAAAATTTIQNQGTGRYTFTVSGGTLNATRYQIRNTDVNGLSFSGTPAITSLDLGDFQLGVNGGSMITVTDTAIDANASKQISYVQFATTTGISTGFNVTRVGTSTASWTFLSHYGNYAGESYDNDGSDACGRIRWSDSSCLFVNQGHFRWRADDGGVGVPSSGATSEWYNASWSKRKRIAVSNPTGSTLTNQAVQVVVNYDADMQSDFDDLRFTDSTGTSSIPYWIESRTASASSTVWVKLSSIPANGSSVIYMYYGNGGAADAGDGSNTFTFFDDFEDDNVSEYSGDIPPAVYFDTDTSFNHNYSYGLKAANVSAQTPQGIYRSGSLIPRDSTIRFYQYMDAAEEDEPCTFFAVGGLGNNYAVCLDQYPSEKLIIAKDVESNDGSGTVLASTTVTYATGWYEVRVNWLSSGNQINVTVYDSTGAVFATLNTTDGSYTTTRGMGFGFWFQHGGWDFYSAWPYVSTQPTYVFGSEQVSGGANWLAAEDTSVSGVSTNSNVRLRFTVQNTGSALTSKQFKLQVAAKNALNCESTTGFTDVPTQSGGSCTGSAACIAASSQFTDQTDISDLLSRPASMTFTQGKIVEDPSATTNAFNVGTNEATEVEYNFQLTTNAVSSAYCFRTARVDTGALDSYDHVAEVVMAHRPSISNFSFPLSYYLGGTGIVLTEGTTTTVSATGTVTDLNGYSDMQIPTSTIYRSGVTSACAANVNNCYSQSCTLSACAGSTCTVTCTAQVQYLADPTDTGSFSAQDWLASIRVVDNSGLSATATTTSVELNTLYGLRVDTNVGSIDFGSLALGTDTGTVNATSSVVNTGNAAIDIDLDGTDLVGPAGPSGKIDVGQQKYSTSTFTYASCSVCQFLSGAASPLEVDLPKPTATSTAVTDDVYWGIGIPSSGVSADLHTGINTFMARSD